MNLILNSGELLVSKQQLLHDTQTLYNGNVQSTIIEKAQVEIVGHEKRSHNIYDAILFLSQSRGYILTFCYLVRINMQTDQSKYWIGKEDWIRSKLLVNLTELSHVVLTYGYYRWDIYECSPAVYICQMDV